MKGSDGRSGMRPANHGVNEREERFFLTFLWGIEYFWIPCTAHWDAISRQREAARPSCCPAGSPGSQLLVFAMTVGESWPCPRGFFSIPRWSERPTLRMGVHDRESRAGTRSEMVSGGLSQRSGC